MIKTAIKLAARAYMKEHPGTPFMAAVRAVTKPRTEPSQERWETLSSILDNHEYQQVQARVTEGQRTPRLSRDATAKLQALLNSPPRDLDTNADKLFPAETYRLWFLSLDLPHLAERAVSTLPAQTDAGRRWRHLRNLTRMIDPECDGARLAHKISDQTNGELDRIDIIDTMMMAWDLDSLERKQGKPTTILSLPGTLHSDRQSTISPTLRTQPVWDPNALWGIHLPAGRWIPTHEDDATTVSAEFATYVARFTAWPVTLVTDRPLHADLPIQVLGHDDNPYTQPAMDDKNTPMLVIIDATGIHSPTTEFCDLLRSSRVDRTAVAVVGPLTSRQRWGRIPTEFLPTHDEFLISADSPRLDDLLRQLADPLRLGIQPA